jgi:hypothetical protein
MSTCNLNKMYTVKNLLDVLRQRGKNQICKDMVSHGFVSSTSSSSPTTVPIKLLIPANYCTLQLVTHYHLYSLPAHQLSTFPLRPAASTAHLSNILSTHFHSSFL